MKWTIQNRFQLFSSSNEVFILQSNCNFIKSTIHSNRKYPFQMHLCNRLKDVQMAQNQRILLNFPLGSVMTNKTFTYIRFIWIISLMEQATHYNSCQQIIDEYDSYHIRRTRMRQEICHYFVVMNGIRLQLLIMICC